PELLPSFGRPCCEDPTRAVAPIVQVRERLQLGAEGWSCQCHFAWSSPPPCTPTCSRRRWRNNPTSAADYWRGGARAARGAAGVVEAGEGGVVARYPLVNELASPTEYNAEPRGLFQAHRDMRDRGLEVLAVYHSHPTSPPVPSRKDRECNSSEDVVSVIISLTTSPPAVRAWWLTADAHRE